MTDSDEYPLELVAEISGRNRHEEVDFGAPEDEDEEAS
jgi:hypothetical protein